MPRTSPHLHDQEQDREADRMIFAAEIGRQSVPALDVHGYTVAHALEAADEFVNTEHAGVPRKSPKLIRIITGRGTGKVQQAILHDLQKKSYPFIVAFRPGQISAHGWSSIFVVLAPNCK